MPELPEVEAARRAIQENCLGKKIKKSVVADDSIVIDGVSASDFEAALLGKTIVAAHRKGKNLWLQLDSPPFPSFQFGMAGAIYIKGVAVTKYKRSAVKEDDQWPSKYSKVFVELDGGMEFSFTDKRRFAKVRLLKDPASVPPISELGPDALLEPMTDDELVASLSKKKKVAIKALLLNQSFISGIGNWIADEVLYQARIHPEQPAATLSRECCATLNKCIKEVIEKAVEVGADSSQFPSNWIFHSREKKPGEAFIDGNQIEFITSRGRTTAFVPELQKEIGNHAANKVSKQRKQSTRGKGNRDGNADNNVDEPEADEDNNAEATKGKKGRKPQGQVKKSPAKRKSEESDDEENDNGDDVKEEEEEDNAKNKRSKKETDGKPSKAGKSRKKKVLSNQKSKKKSK
ncbi:formamidopyrimidine-DNA glycosylase isoform X1 [Cannabis sativa]|uniref:formamidopyrimidine-DNA glycosylase isoform X1 n=1 Tax=Cannabis sativa TaxID=3483 RepID=UPI0029CAA058|nr:formamidopyrimidine-DNA glycosylase isoform X1 [Cannabis sativa]